MTGPTAYCVSCRQDIPADAMFCQHCGADQRPPNLRPQTPQPLQQSTNLPHQAPPQAGGQPFPPVYASSGIPSGFTFASTPDVELAELARQYRESQNNATLSAIAGLLCLWPLLIITFVQYQKMKQIRQRVAQLGVVPNDWMQQNGISENRYSAIYAGIAITLVLAVVLWTIWLANHPHS